MERLGLKPAIISVEPGSYNCGSVPVHAMATGFLLVKNLSPDTPLIVSSVKTKAPFYDGAVRRGGSGVGK